VNDLDAELRRALRPVDPPPGFTGRVLARVSQGQRSPRHTRWRIPLGLAAAVLLGLGIYMRAQQRQQLAGLEARRQVIEALRLTDEKLDLAFQTVKDASGT
jgi:hypothetical protein